MIIMKHKGKAPKPPKGTFVVNIKSDGIFVGPFESPKAATSWAVKNNIDHPHAVGWRIHPVFRPK